MLREKLRPVIAALAGTAAGFVAASLVVQKLGAEGMSSEVLPLVAAGCGGFGALAGALFGSLVSARLGAYWFWFLAATIGLGLAPLGATGADGEAGPLWLGWTAGETPRMLLHSAGAAALAAAATIAQQMLLARRSAEAAPRRAGFGEIAVGAAAIVAIGYGLHWLGAAPLLLLALVAPLAGKQSAAIALRFVTQSGAAAQSGDRRNLLGGTRQLSQSPAAESAARKNRWRGEPHA